MWYLNWIAVVLVEMRHVNSNEHSHGYVRLVNGDPDEEIYVVV
jgi:hypothetical protein